MSLALESKGFPVSNWPQVLPDALNAIRSLLCTATNSTPHERMFSFQRRSVSGSSLPSWLLQPGEVLLKRFGRTSKYEPGVDVVELLEATPAYAHVKFPDGREDTVALRNLAPYPNSSKDEKVDALEDDSSARAVDDIDAGLPTSGEDSSEEQCLRRSTRVRNPIERFVP